MKKETTDHVVSVSRQWWLKVNTKPIRSHAFDGAAFPHIIKVQYTVDGQIYFRRKWIPASVNPPCPNTTIKVIYLESNPNKAKILL